MPLATLTVSTGQSIVPQGSSEGKPCLLPTEDKRYSAASEGHGPVEHEPSLFKFNMLCLSRGRLSLMQVRKAVVSRLNEDRYVWNVTTMSLHGKDMVYQPHRARANLALPLAIEEYIGTRVSEVDLVVSLTHHFVRQDWHVLVNELTERRVLSCCRLPEGVNDP